MASLPPLLDRHLRVLSIAYPLSIDGDGEYVIVHGFRLPPGFNQYTIDVLVEIPAGYPTSPPGVGSRVYLPASLRFRGNRLQDLHEGTTPGWGNWAWFCYQYITWDPHHDDLVKFMEMVRADLTDPPTA